MKSKFKIIFLRMAICLAVFSPAVTKATISNDPKQGDEDGFENVELEEIDPEYLVVSAQFDAVEEEFESDSEDDEEPVDDSREEQLGAKAIEIYSQWEIERPGCQENQGRCAHEIVKNTDQNSKIASIFFHADWNKNLRNAVTINFRNVAHKEVFKKLLEQKKIGYNNFTETAVVLWEKRIPPTDLWQLIFDSLEEVEKLPAELKSEIQKLLWHPHIDIAASNS